MKRNLYTLIFVFFVSLIATSCKTASKLYQQGDYDKAVELAAKKLQKDPHDLKLLDVIQNAYQFAVNDHENRIRSNAQSNSEMKYEWMLNDYNSLQRMYEAIYKVPSVFTLVNPVDYSSYLITYREKAAGIRYERGMALMQKSSKDNFRNAYHEFQTALQFAPENRNIQESMLEAYDYAVTNVVILPIQQYGGYAFSSYSLGNNNMDDQLIRNLQYNSGNEFVKFFSDHDARRQNIRTDQVIDMNLATINIGRYHDTRSTRTVSKDIVSKEIVYKPDSIVKEYTRVYAEVITTRRTINSSASLQINVRDYDDRWLWNDRIAADHNWSTEFASFTGDARALSETDKQLIAQRQEHGPNENEIMNCLTSQLSTDALYRIKNYFNRY
jgi:hypothetical protein